MVETLSETADERFESDPIRLATVHEMLGRSFRAFDQPERAESHLRRSLELRTKLHGPDHELTLGTRNSLAEVLKDQDEFQEAASHYQQIETALLAQRPADAQARRRLASVLSNRARLLERMEKCVEARSLMQQTIDLLATDETDEADETSRRLVLFARGHAAGLDSKMGSCQQALRDMRDVHRGITDAFGASHPATTTSAIKLAGLCIEAGKPQDAIELLDELPTREEAIRLRARALADRGDLDAAVEHVNTLDRSPETHLLHARLLLHSDRPEDAPHVLASINGEAISDSHRFEQAVLQAVIEESADKPLDELARRAFDGDAPALSYATAITTAYRTETVPQSPETAAELGSIASRLAHECGEHHRWTVDARLLQARALAGSGETAAARVLLDPLLAWSVSEHGPEHPMTRKIRRAIDG